MVVPFVFRKPLYRVTLRTGHQVSHALTLVVFNILIEIDTIETQHEKGQNLY